MKKVLSATTALVCATMLVAPAAQAADPIKIQIGGFMEQWVGYADNDSSNNVKDLADFDTKSDTEVYFRGSTTLDNGLTIAVRIDMEGDHPGGAIDDSFLTVSSDTYGRLIIGQTKHAAYDIQHTSPDVGIGLADGDTTDWVPAPAGFNGRAGDFSLDPFVAGNDANKIKYFTPSFYGLTLAASYSPEESDSNNQPERRVTGDGPAWSIGGIFTTEFEGVGIGINGGIARVGNENLNGSANHTSATMYEGGGEITYQGFTLSGGYLRTKQEDSQRQQVVAAESINGYGFDLGVAYATGPYAISLSYGYNEEEGTVNVSDNNTEEAWMLSGRYDLGAGVSLRSSIFSVEYEGEDSNDAGADDNDAWGVVAGMRVDF